MLLPTSFLFHVFCIAFRRQPIYCLLTDFVYMIVNLCWLVLNFCDWHANGQASTWQTKQWWSLPNKFATNFSQSFSFICCLPWCLCEEDKIIGLGMTKSYSKTRVGLVLYFFYILNMNTKGKHVTVWHACILEGNSAMVLNVYQYTFTYMGKSRIMQRFTKDSQ